MKIFQLLLPPWEKFWCHQCKHTNQCGSPECAELHIQAHYVSSWRCALTSAYSLHCNKIVEKPLNSAVLCHQLGGGGAPAHPYFEYSWPFNKNGCKQLNHNIYCYLVNTIVILTHHVFQPIVAIIRYIQFYNHPSFYLLYLHTLASVYTLEVRCTGMLFM
jgi:hypothetical protein